MYCSVIRCFNNSHNNSALVMILPLGKRLNLRENKPLSQGNKMTTNEIGKFLVIFIGILKNVKKGNKYDYSWWQHKQRCVNIFSYPVCNRVFLATVTVNQRLVK